MNQGLLHLHNLLRWVVLILALVTIFKSLTGMSSGKSFNSGARKTALFLMISVDLQLFIGLALYFMNGWAQVLGSGADAMRNAYSRFFAVEHTLGMLIAIILIHIGYSATKRDVPDAAKFRKLFWLTFIALVVMIISIPWPFREMVARPWFPGMSV